MNPAQDNKLSALADKYAEHLHELLELLHLEHDALKNREFENIRACTKQKEILLRSLEQLDAERVMIEQQADAKTTKELHSCFRGKIAALLKKCSEMNSLNGGIVEISKQFNLRMLNTILGASTNNAELYNAKGINSSHRLKQVFAKI